MLAWFEVQPFPWHDPRVPELVQLLLNAYSDIDNIEMRGKLAGVVLHSFVPTKGSGPAWESLLNAAASQGKTRLLLDGILADPGVAGYHPKLRELMKGQAPSPPPAPPPAAQGMTKGQAPSPTAASPVQTALPKSRDKQPPSEEVLFSWLHLSDIHVGHGDAAHQWNQERVLDALVADLQEHFGPSPAMPIPSPEVIFVTGDIAFSGKAEQYARSKARLAEIAAAVRLELTRVFTVPGNHDVDRDADKDLLTGLTVQSARNGITSLDALLEDMTGRPKIAGRSAAYAAFARELAPVDAESDRLFWRHGFTSSAGIQVRLFGLNTALLAADGADLGKLCLGEQQLHAVKSTKEELAILLTHHPFSWLSDGPIAASHVAQHADIHLSGHVHGAESQGLWGGGGTGMVRVVAGAAHNERVAPGVPESHGYNLAAVVRTMDDRVVLRVWPWKWQSQTQDFRADVANLPKNKPFAEHVLTRVRLPHKAAR